MGIGGYYVAEEGEAADMFTANDIFYFVVSFFGHRSTIG